MFQAENYLQQLTELLKQQFGRRLLYVGLQGSYLRGEATESSDIDVMVILDQMSISDLAAYRQAVESLESPEKSCGFICGLAEMQHWNSLEICHLLHTTRDYLGELKALAPTYTDEDVRAFVKMSLGNLYHEICHRFIHGSREANIAQLPFTYKGVFFILQNLHYLRSGDFIPTKRGLLAALEGQDRAVLEKALALGRGEAWDFEEAFSLLFSWCQQTMSRI